MHLLIKHTQQIFQEISMTHFRMKTYRTVLHTSLQYLQWQISQHNQQQHQQCAINRREHSHQITTIIDMACTCIEFHPREREKLPISIQHDACGCHNGPIHTAGPHQMCANKTDNMTDSLKDFSQLLFTVCICVELVFTVSVRIQPHTENLKQVSLYPCWVSVFNHTQTSCILWSPL